jgi:16S rRNA (adenine(1408)-N(1))-methyltransferase
LHSRTGSRAAFLFLSSHFTLINRQERKEFMEIIQGKNIRFLQADEFSRLLEGYDDLLLDLGAGDGKFVLHAARAQARLFALGVDACRENLQAASRSTPANALFVIANACALPAELYGRATRVTVNFPWGSLRDGLLNGEPALMEGLFAVMRPGAQMEVRLNASALAEAGHSLASGGAQVRETLRSCGFRAAQPERLAADALRGYPSTWAKRLAFGRAPEAVLIRAARPYPVSRYEVIHAVTTTV